MGEHQIYSREMFFLDAEAHVLGRLFVGVVEGGANVGRGPRKKEQKEGATKVEPR